MPASCSVIGCKSRGYDNSRKYYSFPLINNRSSKTLAITVKRQNAWVAALNRQHFGPNLYKNARVCDLHFISGRSAHYMDVDNPDWVPTKCLGYEQVEKKHSQSVDGPDIEFIDVNAIDKSSTTVDVHVESTNSKKKFKLNSIKIEK